ncbi:hypothetical protein CBR_g45290 [Chara braunii]|uniref:Serine/threonine-protein phosphatase n=1 Tax=Chara braunii TaxID=69332 RepID=A0A388LY98_CHABU|nr:hypothetical protein CBR_g45290 [Chara braunii]|eukprot:GBG87231.1 hypothetical protein CBR_g45290 [Chara braunii]
MEVPRPAPTFSALVPTKEFPGARCGHTLTALAAVGEPDSPSYVGPRLILFGGATALEGSSGPATPGGGTGGAGIRLAGATADVHCFDVRTNTWSRLQPTGESPSPRAAHAATAVGTMVVIQGGIGPAGLASDDLHVLDLTGNKPRWHRVVVQGPGPGPRYGHVMALVGQRFLLSMSGNDGKRPLADVWALDTAAKPYEWRRLEPEGEGPPPCMYATASARSDGLLLLCGGREGSSSPLSGAYGLARHRDGRWEWAVAPGISPSPRYQHAAAFVNARLHVSGGALGGGRMVEDASSVAVLDTAAGVWCDRKGVVTSPRTGKYSTDGPAGEGGVDLTRRCRHAAAAVADRIYIYGGLRGGVLLGDMLVAEDSGGAAPGGGGAESAQGAGQPAAAAPAGANNTAVPPTPSMGRAPAKPTPPTPPPFDSDANSAKSSQTSSDGDKDAGLDDGGDSPSAVVMASAVAAPLEGDASEDISSENVGIREHPVDAKDVEVLVEAAAAEAAVANQIAEKAARASAKVHQEEDIRGPGDEDRQIDVDSPSAEDMAAENLRMTPTYPRPPLSPAPNHASEIPGVRLHHRAVVVAAESGGPLGGLVRQLSIDQFENEGRRVSFGPMDGGQRSRLLDRQVSLQGVHKRVLAQLLKPRGWRPPVKRLFFLDVTEVQELCEMSERIFASEPTVLQIKAPVKIFGDLHGQFGDLMRLFDEYGSPSTAGDITYIDYLFLGDYVDRGQHSLETICLLLALKIEHPRNVHLIRGNHEAADINALFGFRIECIERMGEKAGIWAWQRMNQLFNYLPLAAVIEKKIICMHGGIGRSIHHVSQIEGLHRPLTMETGSVILMDLLWSDPTENDSVEGLRPNARGPGLVSFGPDRVMEFCRNNDLQLIVRAHECVMDGFERFAQGHLITLFSATNYCGTANNAGAILVLGRDLVVVPKLIHPLPPPGNMASPEHQHEDTWMQELNVSRPPTPTRGRPQPNSDRTSLAWI